MIKQKYCTMLQVITLLTFTLLMTGCGEKQAEPAAPEIITLNGSNLMSFQQTMLKDYAFNRNELLKHFKAFKKENDGRGFMYYRNKTWTPRYIERKEYYQAVYDANEGYIDENEIKSLFLAFNNLIYIGIELKHGLLKNDKNRLKSAYNDIKADHKVISQFKQDK